MPPQKLDVKSFSPDIRAFICLLQKHQVEYMIVGGEAVIFYGYPRLTGDVDFFSTLPSKIPIVYLTL